LDRVGRPGRIAVFSTWCVVSLILAIKAARALARAIGGPMATADTPDAASDP